jgi:serine/threonine protein kinase
MSVKPANPHSNSDASDRGVEWKGTARYEVTRRLGEGGMGVVYEAFDLERRQRVALKTLQHFSPAALYRFKQEFRTLADVTHTNLVHLHELVATEADGVFFTMELVDGTDFVTYTRRPGVEGLPGEPESTSSIQAEEDLTVNEAGITKSFAQDTTTTVASGPESGVLQRASGRPPRSSSRPPKMRTCPADMERLRLSLRQLVEGVSALHAGGRLHRDIKPSNVLVTPAGRVVLLDFGVATELGAVVDEKMVEREVVGTVRYMAPEQATEDALSFASDWYAVGAMLYEALVGQPPFVGPRLDVVTRKAMLDPRPPRECVDGVPADLDALCCDLLRRVPGDRPTGAQVIRRLGGRGERMQSSPAIAQLPTVPLVGRDAHLKSLRHAFDDAKTGRSVTVLVHGESGMGKSALVEQFLDGLVGTGEAVTLRGRAYERESVPYKAFDSIVDALSRYLMRLSDDDGTVTMPADVWALARLFPVLRRVAPIAASMEPAAADPAYVRRHAFTALRALLAELARHRPLVVWIDDVQWGDVDSVNLLFEMVRAPLAPPLLVLLTYREEEGASSPFVLEMRARWPVASEVRNVDVGPLAMDDARSLARTLLGAHGPAPLDVAEAIARESGGSAFLIEELVRSVVARRERGASDGIGAGLGMVTLDNMVSERLALLDSVARRLVEVVAVGGRPLELTLAGDAAGIYENVEDVVASLRGRGFVRTGFRVGHETVEMSHDGIRETLVGHLPEEDLREHHRRLARVLEGSSTADPEAIAAHLFGAGEPKRAAAYAERAADQAAVKLAFDQAIRLYKRTIDTIGEAPLELRRLRARLAEVMEGAGRGPEASNYYLLAAEGAPTFEKMELRRRAAEQLITSGHIDDGIRMMRGVFEVVGLRMPSTSAGALFWLLVYRLWSWIRGWSFKERDPEGLSPLDRAQIDACHAVSVSMVFIDAIFALYTQSLHSHLALAKGDRFRVLRALSMHTVGLASRGGPESSRERAFAETVRSLAQKTTEPDAWTYVDVIRAFCLFLHGRWKELIAMEADLLVALPHNRGGWRNQVRVTAIWALVLTGGVAQVRRSIGALIDDAENRGDLSTAVNLRIGYTNLVWLADDDVDEARRQLRAAAGMWSHSKFFLQNYRVLLAEANIEMYAGNGALAYEHVVTRWGQIRRSLMLAVQYIRADAYYLRARAALASADTAARRGARLAEAERYVRKLEQQKMPWTDLLAHSVRASLELSRGDRVGAIEHLRAAIDRSEEAGMALHGAAARFQLGSLLGAGEGRKLVETAEDWMLAQDIHAPERMSTLLIPGKWSRPSSG